MFDFILPAEATIKIELTGTLRVILDQPQEPYQPGPLFVLFKETSMADILKCRVLFPPPGVDVDTRELSVSVAGAEPTVKTYPSTASASDEFDVEQDAEVLLSLVDIDDGGNRSEASQRTVQAIDNFPPAQPGELGFEVTGETEGP
jgi:hypothetical protein